jgi:hypothetical protein
MVKHASVGPDLSRVEWEASGTHVIDGVPAGELLVSNGASIGGISPVELPRYGDIIFTFGNGIDLIDAGEPEQWIEIPFNCSIQSARLIADATGDFQVDIWKSTFAAFPPTVADSITAGTPPVLTSNSKSENALTGWTKSLARGEWLKVHINSSSLVKRVVLSIGVITG